MPITSMRSRLLSALRPSWVRWSLIALIVSNLPYLMGWLRQTPDLIFTGIIFNAIDANAYLAVMQQGWHGQWLMTLPFTVEPHPPLFLYEFYIVIGNISRWLFLSPLAGYHLFRLLGGFFMFAAAYEYLSLHVRWPAARDIAFVLLCIGSGVGWWMQAFMPVGPEGISAIDFWLMDAYAFFSVLLVPHFVFAWGLALTLLNTISRSALGLGKHNWLWAFVAGAGLAVVHPKVTPAIGAVAAATAIMFAWRMRPRALAVLVALVASGVGVLIPASYYIYAMSTSPIFAALTRQDITMSPPIGYYALGFGLVTALALAGASVVYKKQGIRELPLLLWPLIVLFMLYMPVQIQRRFIMGVQVPLAGLAGIGIVVVVLPAIRRWWGDRVIAKRYPARRLRLLALNLMLAVSAMSNVLLLLIYSLNAWGRSPTMFVSNSLVQAATWLDDHSTDTTFTLSAYPTGNYIPANSSARTCIGHWNLTIDFYTKEEKVTRIFDASTSSTNREALVRELGCGFLLYSPAERALGKFDPATAPYLNLRFSLPDIDIYEVLPTS
jgi:hypothetical protein